MDDRLLKLPRFSGLSRRTSQVLSQNISRPGIKAALFLLAQAERSDVAYMQAGSLVLPMLYRLAHRNDPSAGHSTSGPIPYECERLKKELAG